MKKNIILALILSFSILSCKSDDANSNLSNAFIKELHINSNSIGEELPEYGFFYDATITFRYNKENKPNAIQTSLRYRDLNYDPIAEEFPNKLVDIQISKQFIYNDQTNTLSKEITTKGNIRSEKTFVYNELNQIKSIQETAKESIFTYNTVGQLTTIETKYKATSDQHLNSVQYLVFDNKNNLQSVAYLFFGTTQMETLTFHYSTFESIYKGNALNYTLTDSLEDYISHPIHNLSSKYPNLLDNIEFFYKGNLVVNGIGYSDNYNEALYQHVLNRPLFEQSYTGYFKTFKDALLLFTARF